MHRVSVPGVGDEILRVRKLFKRIMAWWLGGSASSDAKLESLNIAQNIIDAEEN